MNNTELLPCPFCGNTEPKLVPQGNAPEAFVYCGKCDLTGKPYRDSYKKMEHPRRQSRACGE